MSKVDMNYANYKIYGEKSRQSNKNLLSDLLNEVAEAVGFDMCLLREDYSSAKGYQFEEEDIECLREMADVAKSSEGKRIRCKDFRLENADTVEFFSNAFLRLARNNGVPDDALFEAEYQMLSKTDFVVMHRNIRMATDEFNSDLERQFFAPTDYLPDVEDGLTKSDRCIFLLYIQQSLELDAKTMRGIYWCFVEERQGKNNKDMLDYLHSMPKEEKEERLEKIMHQALFESKLQKDDEYVETLQEYARIVGGGGKLQDKKRVIPLAKKLCEVMDRNADGYMPLEEYAYGEPDFSKVPKWHEENIRGNLSESRELMCNALKMYYSLMSYREKNPVTEEDERMIEIMYKSRFGESMF